jgi:O6-methylguanine-DNA--protein-cysteine methyltransferase
MMLGVESEGAELGLHAAPASSLEPALIRERLVNPSVTGFCRLTVVSMETVSADHLQDGRRGRALTPWGMSRIVWSPSSILRWELDEKAISASCISPSEQGLPVDDAGARDCVERLLAGLKDPMIPVSVSVCGTPFQHRVWRALLGIPRGSVTSYGRLANTVGSAGAARAVGAACAANPVALMIPCHRVVRESGDLNGYRWGVQLKELLLAWEFGMLSRTRPCR